MRRTKVIALLAFTGLLVAQALFFGVAVAPADELSESLYGVRPSSEDSQKAMEGGPRLGGPATDSEAAEELPHQNLGREEAVNLLTSVFGAEIEDAGPFTNLEVQKFLSDDVAVVNAGTATADATGGSSESESTQEKPVLLESSVPIRVENSEGEATPLDLSLERAEGELQPEAPLVEAGIPEELGEGISLPEAGVKISLEGGAGERAPSTVSDEAAVYPNVAEDTDFAVTPSPTGIETFTQLRSADAPRTESFNLDMPAGATLEKTENGGAEVVHGKETLLVVPAPTAMDATGAPVPVELETAGNSLTLKVAPDESAAYPILIDPLFESYNWTTNPPQFPGEPGKDFNAFGGWVSATNSPSMEVWETEHIGPYGRSGLFVAARSPNEAPQQGNWNYYVPRMTSDYTKYGVRPTTYINGAVLQQLEFRFWEGIEPNGKYGISRQAAPYFQGGIWDSINGGWISVASRNGVEGQLLDPSYSYIFSNGNHNVNGKNFGVALLGLEPFTQQLGIRTLYVGIASIELTDNDAPEFGAHAQPSGWVNQQPTAVIPFNATDQGLGVYRVAVEETTSTGGKKIVETKQGCVGGVYHPCPRTWTSSEGQLSYDPSVMPTGEDWVKLAAYDPIGHSSVEKEAAQAEAKIKVDHTAPALALTGTITEQGSLGYSRPSYELEINSTDGTTASPQSGVAKTVIEVDGKVVNESSPGCTTQNCSVSRKWTLEASQYASGSHVLKVVSIDAVGNSTTKTQKFSLQPAAEPSVGLSGSMTEQATLGTSRPRYTLNVNSSTEAGFNGSPVGAPTFSSSFGETGSGKGQFKSPEGSAVDSKGNLWVVDGEDGRVEEFNVKGENIGQFGEFGSNPGQLMNPTGLAIDSAGDFWITCSDGRIEEFSSAGKFIKQIGKEGSADGSFNHPEDIAFDSKGNLWVADWGNSRIEEVNQEGKFLAKATVEGSEVFTPWGLAIAPDGSIWVADTINSHLQKFSSEGKYLGSYAENGSGNGNLANPIGLRIDSAGNIYVTDAVNERVQVFNSSGEYLTQFGSAGTGAGQFKSPGYLTIDSTGNIWVDDSANRIERWHSQVAPPTFSLAFGSKGIGAGQFSTPSSVATDSAGNVWVVDRNNNRIEEFNSKGEFLGQFGSKGTGAGQLTSPWGIAIDPSGNIWVTDTGNTRVVEFNGKGEFVATFGTNVDKTKVEAGGTQAQKNLCTAASKDVCQAGTAGSLEGQMKQPTGITTSPGGNIFVVEKGNGRVEKFSPTGEILANFGTAGTTEGKLSEPSSVAMSPDGNYLWVADTGNDRIEEWTSTYSFVRAVGKEGTGNGQFEEPYGMAVDSKGNVWVADTYNYRIQGFNSSGDFITKFGKSGSGEGQMSTPYAMASDAGGNLWIADTGHNQIQKWIPPTSKASTVTSEITLDGTSMGTKVGRCGTSACSAAQEWTLEAGSYAVGKHTIQVKATDGLGRSTTKSLTIELQKDTTKPTLEASGSLFNAPEGWVEQDGYALSATATDAGYGITSLIANIDGKQVASWTGSCPNGGCKASISKSIEMSAYSGGAHSGEIIATDGAGNVSKKLWTINVDPEGHISTLEATATLEAVDTTSPANMIGASREEDELEGTAPGLGIEPNPSGLEMTGTETPAEVALNSSGAFVVQVPESAALSSPCETQEGNPEAEREAKEVEPINLEEEVPIETEPCIPQKQLTEEAAQAEREAASQGEAYGLGSFGLVPISVEPVDGNEKATEVVNGSSALTPNTDESVDLVERPLYDGVMTFQNIRDASAPETYSWEVGLEPGQELKQIDEDHAEVYFEGEHPAFGITATPAHDAIGTEVPTHIKVEGNIVTLIVEFNQTDGSPFIFPVVAGTGWQGGFETYIVEMPPPEPMPGEVEEEGTVEFEEGDSVLTVKLAAIGPPVAQTSELPGRELGPAPAYSSKKFKFSMCRFPLSEASEPGRPPDEPPPDRRLASEECHREIQGTKPLWGTSVHGNFDYKNEKNGWVWVPLNQIECSHWGKEQPAKVHCEGEPTHTGSGPIEVTGDYRFAPGKGSWGFTGSTCLTVYGSLFKNGNRSDTHIDITPALPGEACHWEKHG